MEAESGEREVTVGRESQYVVSVMYPLSPCNEDNSKRSLLLEENGAVWVGSRVRFLRHLD